MGWGKLNRKYQVSNRFFFLGGGGGGAPKSLTAINTCLDEMEELKEEIQHYKKKKKSLQKKVLKSESA